MVVNLISSARGAEPLSCSAGFVVWLFNAVAICLILSVYLNASPGNPEVPSDAILNFTNSAAYIYHGNILRQDLSGLLDFRDQWVAFQTVAHQLWTDRIMSTYGVQVASAAAHTPQPSFINEASRFLLQPVSSWAPTLCMYQPAFCEPLQTAVRTQLSALISGCLRMWTIHFQDDDVELWDPQEQEAEIAVAGANVRTCDELALAAHRMIRAFLPSTDPVSCADLKQSGLMFVRSDGVISDGKREIVFRDVDRAVRSGEAPVIASVIVRALCARMPGTDCDFPSTFRDEGRKALQVLLERRTRPGQPLMKAYLPCLANIPGLVSAEAIEMQRRHLFRDRQNDPNWRNGSIAAAYLPYALPMDCWDSFTVRIGACADDVPEGSADGPPVTFATPRAVYHTPSRRTTYGQALGTVVLGEGLCVPRKRFECLDNAAFRLHVWPTAVNDTGNVMFAVAYASTREFRTVSASRLSAHMEGLVDLPMLSVEPPARWMAFSAAVVGVIAMTGYVLVVRTVVLGAIAGLVPYLFGEADATQLTPHLYGPLRRLAREAILIGKISSALLALVPRELRQVVAVNAPPRLSLAFAVGASRYAIASLQKTLKHPPHRVIEEICIVIACSLKLPSREVPTFEAKLASFAEYVGGRVHPCPPGFFTALTKLSAVPQRLGDDVVPLERHVLIPITKARPVGGVSCGPLPPELCVVTPRDLDTANDTVTSASGSARASRASRHDKFDKDSLGGSLDVDSNKRGGPHVRVSLCPDNAIGASADTPLVSAPALVMYESVPVPRSVVTYSALAAAALAGYLQPFLDLRPPSDAAAEQPDLDDDDLYSESGVSSASGHWGRRGEGGPVPVRSSTLYGGPSSACRQSSTLSLGVSCGPITHGYLRLTTASDVFPEAFASGWPLSHAALFATLADKDGLGIVVDVGPPNVPFLASRNIDSSRRLASLPSLPSAPPHDLVDEKILLRVFDAVQLGSAALPSASEGHPMRMVAQVVVVPQKTTHSAVGTSQGSASSKLLLNSSARLRAFQEVVNSEGLPFIPPTAAAVLPSGNQSQPLNSHSQGQLPTHWSAAMRQLSDTVARGFARRVPPSVTYSAILAHARRLPSDVLGSYILTRWRCAAESFDTSRNGGQRELPHTTSAASLAPSTDPFGLPTDGVCAAPLPLPTFELAGLEAPSASGSSRGRFRCDVSVQSSVSVEDVVEDADHGGSQPIAPKAAVTIPAPRRIAVLYLSTSHSS